MCLYDVKVIHLIICLDFIFIQIIIMKLIKKIIEHDNTIGSKIAFWKFISRGKRQILAGLKFSGTFILPWTFLGWKQKSASHGTDLINRTTAMLLQQKGAGLDGWTFLGFPIRPLPFQDNANFLILFRIQVMPYFIKLTSADGNNWKVAAGITTFFTGCRFDL